MEKHTFFANICDHEWVYLSPKNWICKLCKKKGIPCEPCEGSGEYCGDLCLFCDGFGVEPISKEINNGC